MYTPRYVLDSWWQSGLVQFLCFAALFATYDLKILARQRNAPDAVSLVNYVVRDGRIDESAMYMAPVRECIDGHWASTDPYLKDHRHEPDIRPRLPMYVGYGCHLLGANTLAHAEAVGIPIGGATNAGVLLMHSIPPALAAVLLVRVSATLVGPGMAMVLTLLAVGGICYQGNFYVDALRFTQLGGPASYNPELHLFGPYSLHLEFNRYFSPGITFGIFLLGMWPLAVDPDMIRRRTPLLSGAASGLQLESYPHAALVLAVTAGCLLMFAFRRRRHEAGFRSAAKSLVTHAALMAAACVIVAAPWGYRYIEFRTLPAAADIMQRVGFYDSRVDTQRTPVLAWLIVALLLRRAAHNAAGAEPAGWFERSADRFWAALMVAAAVTVWIPGLLGHAGLFPQPWLIPLRCLCFLVPLLVGYPAVLWFQAARPRWAAMRSSRTLGVAATLGYLAVLFHGEYAAGRNNAHLFAVTPEMARCRRDVLEISPPASILLCDDLRLVSYLVCETDRYSLIGYGASSNATTQEMLERLMIPCVLQGLSFDQFHTNYYAVGHGLPSGPTGAHWALHHGGDARPVEVEILRGMYATLNQLDAAALVRRYPFDYLYLDPARLATRFRPLFETMTGTWLLRPIGRAEQ